VKDSLARRVDLDQSLESKYVFRLWMTGYFGAGGELPVFSSENPSAS